jgi:hypothetical protein
VQKGATLKLDNDYQNKMQESEIWKYTINFLNKIAEKNSNTPDIANTGNKSDVKSAFDPIAAKFIQIPEIRKLLIEKTNIKGYTIDQIVLLYACGIDCFDKSKKIPHSNPKQVDSLKWMSTKSLIKGLRFNDMEIDDQDDNTIITLLYTIIAEQGIRIATPPSVKPEAYLLDLILKNASTDSTTSQAKSGTQNTGLVDPNYVESTTTNTDTHVLGNNDQETTDH